MLNNHFVLCFIIILWFFSAPQFAHSSHQNLSNAGYQLLQSDHRSLTLSFMPLNWKEDSLNIHSQTFHRFRFEGAAFPEQPGAPMLPYGCVLIGIPKDARIDYEILDAQFQTFANKSVAPVPAIKIINEMPSEVYDPDKALYSAEKSVPTDIVKISQPGFFRNQPVVQLHFFPLQFFPAQQRIRKYRRITIRLSFESPSPRALQPVPNEKTESLYKQAILNYEQAKTWRQPVPSAKLKKQRQVWGAGDWYRIQIDLEGMYKITGQFLADNGISLASIDPATIRIYNNGGRELPEALTDPRPDSLIENAIKVDDGGDGAFDASDVILFYGRGVNGCKYNSSSKQFEHTIHHYETHNIYWLTWGNIPGKRMPKHAPQMTAASTVKTTFSEFQFVEEERLNILNSGILWFAESLSKDNPSRAYVFNMNPPAEASPINFRLRLGARSTGVHNFRIALNEQVLHTVSLNGPSSSEEIRVTLKTFELNAMAIPRAGLNTVKIEYVSPQSYYQSYIDWLEVTSTRKLDLNQNLLIFNSHPEHGSVEFQLGTATAGSEQVEIFDISQFHDVKRIDAIPVQTGIISFKDSVQLDSPKRYAAINPKGYRFVSEIERAQMSDIRTEGISADYIIITPSSFYEEARILKSLRENMDSLKTSIVLISDIFDTFGFGLCDPTAIRDFIKFAFENGQPQPAYVLLFGDGHYDYKGIYKDASPNWIPPYETGESDYSESRIIDEWFVRVNGVDRIMDLAIGRLPVNSAAEARQMVNRICAYQTCGNFGFWRNTITVVADDEYGQGGVVTSETFHTTQAEDIAAAFPEHLYKRKIYMVEYPGIRSASVSGITKPMVNQDIVEQINRGTAIIDFIGHSKQDQFAHENVFSLSVEVPKLQNTDMLPFLICASCAFGRFDDPYNRWITEEMLLKDNGGVIATFASAREALAHSNALLNQYLVDYLFDAAGNVRRVGDAIRLAKARVPGINSEKYHLLGDPALILNIPQRCVAIDSLNPDSMRALSKISIYGHVSGGATADDSFDGTALVQVFDPEKQRTYASALNDTLHYNLAGNSIFRGSCSVRNGTYQLKFIVPKDISYGGSTGRVSVYVFNQERMFDGCGSLENLYVGGTASAFQDLHGPQITIGLQNRHFEAGDMVAGDPAFEIIIEDSLSGVNITNEIGHTITLLLDDDPKNKRDITSYFNYDEGSFTRGTIHYALSGMTPGEHQIDIKAWDNFNNSSVASATFVISGVDELTLRKVMNFPNPFISRTTFTFEINQPADICIKIYTLAGRLVRTLDGLRAEPGFNYGFEWNGTDEDGAWIANGVYLYKIIASKNLDDRVLKAETIGKLIIMR
ncbi:type IX secretion system sortase PorU [candidate division KSB1 bacterium]|nr:type IX secretion system sortase PorU [candidate division KSB1 bacterium]